MKHFSKTSLTYCFKNNNPQITERHLSYLRGGYIENQNSTNIMNKKQKPAFRNYTRIV